MGKKVAIFGAGVAGMTAAHELLERGFEVSLYERRTDYVGGKARSVDVPGTSVNGSKPLPGEHGFRFFPGFYKHLGDTMRRIPLDLTVDKKKSKTAFDNLTLSETVTLARTGEPPVTTMVHFPHSFAQLKKIVHAITTAHIGLKPADKDKMAEKLWQILTSCTDRRCDEYEQISWWDFAEVENQSPAYRRYFADGLTRTLVAAKAHQMSAKTGGDILAQLLLLMVSPSAKPDRVLNGPTNEAWLDPWKEYLLSLKLDLQMGKLVTDIIYDEKTNRIGGVKIKDKSTDKEDVVKADYYVFAMPVEIMAGLVEEKEELKNAAPTLVGLHNLAKSTDWMNGAQFYLNDNHEFLDTQRGHVIYLDTPWSLTSISQLQFWPDYDISKHGNGQVKSILSVDISDWHKQVEIGKDSDGNPIIKAAIECTKEEIRKEVWRQLQEGLNEEGKEKRLKDWEEVGVAWYLDRDIVEEAKKEAPHGTAVHLPKGGLLQGQEGLSDLAKTINTEPLLINKVNTWGLRPSAATAITNMFLAGDYVRTFTDLATMEGACEAGRRACNDIIYASKYEGAPLAKIWRLHEPWFLAPIRWWDGWRYNRGYGWKPAFPWLIRVIHFLTALAKRIFH